MEYEYIVKPLTEVDLHLNGKWVNGGNGNAKRTLLCL